MDDILDLPPSLLADFRMSPGKETHTVNGLETEAPVSGDSAGFLNSSWSDNFQSPTKQKKKKKDKENNDIFSVPCSPASVSNDMNISPKKRNMNISPKKSSGDISPKKSSGDISPKKNSRDISPKKSSGDISPKKSSRDISPKKSSRDITPKKSDMKISPRKLDFMVKIEQPTWEDETPTPENQTGPEISESLSSDDDFSNCAQKQRKEKGQEQERDDSEDMPCFTTSADTSDCQEKSQKKKTDVKQDGDVFDSETNLESPSTEVVGKSSKKHKKKKKRDNQDGDVSNCEAVLQSPSPEFHESSNSQGGDVSDFEAVLQSPSPEFHESSKKHKKSKKKKKDERDDVSDSGARLESTSSELCESSKKHKKKKKRDRQNDASSSLAQDDSNPTALNDRESSDNPNIASENVQQTEVEQEVRDDSSVRESSEVSIHTDSSKNAFDMEIGHTVRSKKRRRKTTMQSGDTATMSKKRCTEETHELTNLDGEYENEKPCYICEKSMKSKKKYIRHLAKKHEKHSYQCPRCAKPLSSKTLVKHHMQTCCPLKGSGESLITPYCCQLCPMAYTYRGNLQRHESTEHKVGKPTEVHCAHCDQTFTSVTRAKQHQAKCVEGLAKPPSRDKTFECSICHKLYASPSSRSHHIRTIHQQHTFDCICGKQFRGSSHLSVHKKVCKEVIALMNFSFEDVMDTVAIQMQGNTQET